MQQDNVAYWTVVAQIVPVLGLAAVVEIRLIRWHKLLPLRRYGLGFFASSVLLA
ncbi:hypothetical protein AHIS1636_31950 [Arthrobacter mangrovi]|uniref:Uncharacterized protein n=1 Tax=Arthrobacter mangrovi TaxID=2966350 RepID=A0ABQ5MXR2_9MICC|nr:hypothetical protein AHIS1636_31950 [Arthrobacter mangrovi]